VTIGTTVIFLDNRSTVTRPALPDMILRWRRHSAKEPDYPALYSEPSSLWRALRHRTAGADGERSSLDGAGCRSLREPSPCRRQLAEQASRALDDVGSLNHDDVPEDLVADHNLR
jgi:hypothetical protein